jgi:hypothetical protein
MIVLLSTVRGDGVPLKDVPKEYELSLNMRGERLRVARERGERERGEEVRREVRRR